MKRRRFLEKLGFALPALSMLQSFFIVGCSKEPNLTEPKPPTEDLEVYIEGPNSVRLSQEQSSTITLNGTSNYDKTKYSWMKKESADIDYSAELSTEQILNDTVSKTGNINYKLTGRDSFNREAEANHLLTVLPAFFTDKIYILLSETRAAPPKIYSVDPTNYELELIIDGKDFTDRIINTSSLSKDPKGKYLVFATQKSTYSRVVDIELYDLNTKTIDKIVSSNGISREVSWNPSKDLIAYVEDGRFARRDHDELAFVNPITKEVFYGAGETLPPKEEFWGYHPTWDALGEKIALGGTRLHINADKEVKRTSIYENLFNGTENIIRKQLHSEEYIKDYFNGLVSGFVDIEEGQNGVSWSPEGNLIAESIAIITNNDWINTFIIANADGTGIKQVNIPESYSLPVKPNWSPDGNYLIFSAKRSNGLKTQCIIDKDGNNFKDLSILIDKPNAMITNNTWSG